MAVTFDTLKPDARIFLELEKEPHWWKRFKEDSSLYIEIRKDNQVNVYYEGGSIARIHYCSKHKKLQVFTHHKYLGLPAPSKSSPYIECSGFIDSCLSDVLDRVKRVYSQKNSVNGIITKENWSEKYIQGVMIAQSRQSYLDSEFAYNDDDANNRIDIVKCEDGIITFVELKRINDSRMLHETDATPEVVFQMERYRHFIEKYSSKLLGYYKKLYSIKKSLGIPVPQCDTEVLQINKKPHLMICNTYSSMNKKRQKRIEEVVKILKDNSDIFTYEIKNTNDI